MTPIGDKQLWLASGIGWALPLHCTPLESGWLVQPALLLTTPQFDMLCATLPFQRDGERWFAERLDTLTPAVGVTPDYHMVWDSKRAYEPPEVPPPPPPPTGCKENAFLDFVSKRKGGISHGTLHLAWQAIMQAIPDWLLERTDPIDMHWFKLYALPFRGNWKQHMDVATHRGEAWARNASEGQLGPVIAAKSETMLASTPSKQCTMEWNFELETSPAWDKLAREHEDKIIASIGKVRYIDRIRSMVGHRCAAAVRVYQAYLEKAMRPLLEICPLGDGGRGGLRKTASIDQLRPCAVERDDRHPKCGVDLKVVFSDIGNLAKADAKVYWMSCFQPIYFYLRKCRQHDRRGRRFKRRDTGDGGVLVLDAGGGEVEAETVLAPRERSDGCGVGQEVL